MLRQVECNRDGFGLSDEEHEVPKTAGDSRQRDVSYVEDGSVGRGANKPLQGTM